MTSTRIDTEAAPDVRDLDASAVLDAAVSARRTADAAEARLLALAVHWVDLHPVTPEHPAATFPTQRTGGLASALGPAFFDPAPLAGEGTPGVAEYAVEELAAALGPVAPGGSGAGRGGGRAPLPAPAAVGAGAGRAAAGVEGPPGRQGHHAALPGGGGVRGPAPGGHRPVEPAAGVEPGAPRGPAAVRPRPGRRGRAERAGPPRGLAGPPGVHRHHAGHRPDGHAGRPRPGRSVARPGELLGRLGDHRTLDVRRASALGMLAHPQRALDLATGTDPGTDPAGVRSRPG